MKKIFWILLGVLALALSACASSAGPTAIPTVSLDANSAPINPQSSGGGNSITASAVVVPVKEARLSFVSIGRVTAVNVKLGDQVKFGDILVTLDTTLQESKVREAEANLLIAQTQVRYLIRVGTNQKNLDVANADVQRAQALIDSAKATLQAQSGLVAPFDGTIVSLDIAPSETVLPGQVVIVVGDLSRFRVETTDLSERYISSISAGLAAEIFVEALDQELTGKVIEVSQISSKVGGDVVYKVTLEFDEQPQGLLWGMSADVKIQAAQ